MSAPPMPVHSRRQILLTMLGVVVLVLGCCGAGGWFVNAHFCPEEHGLPYRAWGYRAQVSVIDCGATTNFNTWVTVSTDSTFDLPGTYESTVVFRSTHNPLDISIEWESPLHLIIEYPAGQERYVREAATAWKNITITQRTRK